MDGSAFFTTTLLLLVLSFLLHCFARCRSWETWKCCYLCHCFVYLFSSALRRYIYIFLHSMRYVCVCLVSRSRDAIQWTKSKRLMLPPAVVVAAAATADGGGVGSETHNLVIASSMAHSIHFFFFSSSHLNSIVKITKDVCESSVHHQHLYRPHINLWCLVIWWCVE